jgi:hypothetical protein
VAAEFRIEDLPDIYREEYLYAVEMARAVHDPGAEWNEFTEVLWSYLSRAFGLSTPTPAEAEPAIGTEERARYDAQGDHRPIT